MHAASVNSASVAFFLVACYVAVVRNCGHGFTDVAEGQGIWVGDK
jgi:hypothetical protein